MNKYAVCWYFATGNSFTSLHYEYLLGATTVREIVRDTCDTIWECLKPAYMSARDKNDWIRTADEFYERTNFPNCIGAVDGKHIRIRKPNESGSQFFNYKNFFSTVLMAVADAVYCFISEEVGAYGCWRGVYRVLVGKPEGKNHLRDPGVDGSLISRRILRKWNMGLWTGSSWLRIGAGGGHL